MEKIRVGQIVNTHGIKGECKVKVLTDFADERFQPGQMLHLVNTQAKESLAITVQSARWHKDFLLVVFKEINDMTTAEKYKGFDLVIDRDEIEELDDGFYAFELVGFQVQDETGRYLGDVKQIEETLANDVIRIGRNEKKDLLVPFVDAFVLDIDEEKKKITIQWMEGLE